MDYAHMDEICEDDKNLINFLNLVTQKPTTSLVQDYYHYYYYYYYLFIYLFFCNQF